MGIKAEAKFGLEEIISSEASHFKCLQFYLDHYYPTTAPSFTPVVQVLRRPVPYLHHTVVLKETGLEVLSNAGAGPVIFLFILVIFRHCVESTFNANTASLTNPQVHESAN